MKSVLQLHEMEICSPLGKEKKVPDFPYMKPDLVKIGNRENRKNRVGHPPFFFKIGENEPSLIHSFLNI